MAWTRTFVTLPLDPRWNPYKFYCQICNGNVSIYGKGVRVQFSILGHYLPTFGDIRASRGLWKYTGVAVNHRALFADFNWRKEQITVSILL